MHLRELVRPDFDNLQSTDRLRTGQCTDEFIFMPSIVRSSDLLPIIEM